MTPADWQRAGAIYLPLLAAAIAGLLHRRQPHQFASCLLSVLWTAPSLLALQLINQQTGWWTFPAGAVATFRGMPLELFLGWLLLWGAVPQLALPRAGVWSVAAIMIAIDCILMPLSSAAIILHPHWLLGEAAGVVIVLLPALCLARWTRDNTHLGPRAVLQVVTSGLLFLFLIPEIIFALRPGPGWGPLLSLPGWALQLALQIVFLLALPGLGAVLEFAQRGLGTPIPYDPPQRLVISGIYRFCANPMQLSCVLVMLAWAALLRSGWMAVAACISLVYSAGIAAWDERQDLSRRFGQPWKDYRAAVHDWRCRWTPYHVGEPALLYIARGCKPCSQLRAWLEARSPQGLRILDAETLPPGSIRRMRYDPRDGSETVDGVRAFGRALEHLHLLWALCGIPLRLPGLWQIVQLLLDASGLGPRDIASDRLLPCDLPNPQRR